MQKVISINLNGNAYQLDESGYDTLRDYLARAERQLKDNPDRAEIVADLEQAIADKCRKYLGPHKTVVTAGEVDQIVAEMGPVDTSAGEGGPATADAASGGQKADQVPKTSPKRLYRMLDGAMIAGVCNGRAAYFDVDVTFVRIGFVAAALLTKGVGIIAYVVMMFVVPEANTAEERAAAGGAAFNAREVIDRAKRQYAEGSRQWRRHWRQQRRQWRRFGWIRGVPPAYAAPRPALLPLFGLAHFALFSLMAAMMISLVNTGGILSWQLPPDIPVWAGGLILLIAYQIVVSPIRVVERWAWYPRPEGQPAWFPFWIAVVWMIGLAFVVWIASNHIPEIREFLYRLPAVVREFVDVIRDLVRR
jgi:phage shock protein PspC (stress-responsive transcriptional regulator)